MRKTYVVSLWAVTVPEVTHAAELATAVDQASVLS